VSVAVPSTPPRARVLGRHSLLRRLVRRPAGAFGLAVVAVLVFFAVFAPLVAPYSEGEQNIADRLQGPSGAHVLGTDDLGRDLFSRVVHGTRVEFSVALPAVGGALLAGLLLGVAAGYLGGRMDNAIIVVMDTVQSFPAVILALTLLALLGPSLRNVIIVIAATYAPSYGRVARALVLQTKQQQYVEAERSLGAGPARIVGIHIVPNIIAPLFILLAMDIPSAIATESGLSFLGVGVQPPTPSWGIILNDGFEEVRRSPWGIISAGGALMVATLGFTLLGETLRDLVDPRLSGAAEAMRARRRLARSRLPLRAREVAAESARPSDVP
jgi:peptide/nickel transport system permease protein